MCQELTSEFRLNLFLYTPIASGGLGFDPASIGYILAVQGVAGCVVDERKKTTNPLSVAESARSLLCQLWKDAMEPHYSSVMKDLPTLS